MRKSSGQDMPEIVTGHGATPVIGHQEAEVFEALRFRRLGPWRR